MEKKDKKVNTKIMNHERGIIWGKIKLLS
jgi:hypothetical protein